MATNTDARTILDFFIASRNDAPRAIALDIPPNSERSRCVLSYAELDRMARAIAALLAPRVRPDAIVILALPRTDPHLYAAMLGAMHAGCAYCAIDPSFPTRAAEEIVRDARPIAVIADDARGVELTTAFPTIVRITPRAIDDAVRDAHPREWHEHTPLAIQPTNLAYVIYTSGTTGKPKGVEIEHRSIFNLVEGDRTEFALSAKDRVVQGSSASYDSSLEEIWLAWAAGATVLVMDDETARLGPDLLSWLQHERATVFCPPPTLLRTLDCADPEHALPAIHLLYVGGEALPTDLANLWSRGRRLENGYGPTECTVTCLRSTVHSGEAVTIGRAIPGTHAWVIDPDHAELREITDDSQGELVVGGASLARGYRGQPETTAARFVEHCTLGRVYRTGDLVHRDARGDFHYHGRIDAQVKIRGYRVELGAIEAKLAAHPSVLEAACTVEGTGAQRRLVAHVVARRATMYDAASIDADALRAFLAAELPPYMVPSVIATIASVPRSVGGKVDRKKLPEVGRASRTAAIRSKNLRFDEASTETERLILEAITRTMSQTLGADHAGDEPICATADFFDDLGLDSLTIAMVISRLRANESTRDATVRLAYEHRTARDAARALDTATTNAESDSQRNRSHPGRRAASMIDPAASVNDPAASVNDPAASVNPSPTDIVGTSRPFLATLLQTLFLTGLLIAVSQWMWIPDAGEFLGEQLQQGLVGTILLAAAGVVAVAAYGTLTIIVGLAAKWILIGRYRPMRVRAWSLWHVRHWIVVRLVSMAPWELFEALSIAPFALRLLGARIGAHVHIHRGVRLTDGGWDLLTLEDFATIGQDASLRTIELEAGTLVIGPITVRRGATLETRAGMSPGAELGEGSVLRALSNLRAGLPHARMILDGIPAERVAPAPQPPSGAAPAPALLRFILGAGMVASILALLLLPWSLALRIFGLRIDGSLRDTLFGGAESLVPSLTGLALIGGATVVAGIGTVLLEAILVRMLGRAPTEPYALGSFTALRLSLQSALVEAAGKWLSGTLLWPLWLNAAGARIGRGCEISTVTDVIPSSVEIGRETFFADGIFLGGPRLQAGTATIEPVVIAESCFVGNHAVLPSGTRIARETLVGISTRGDGLPDTAGASWFGHPVFRLPRREVIDAPRELTHDPPLLRRINRWMWELARFALPIGPVFVALLWFRVMEVAESRVSPAVFRFLALPLGLLAALAVLALSILALKWLLVGRVKPGTHPLWSCWCSRWDFLYVAWGMWAAVPLTFLEGSLILVGFLRAMGCRIGRRALLGTGFSHVVDPDMLHFGDDVTVQALFQAHTFEDRVLKVDHVYIRDGATVGANTVMLYGADVGMDTIVEPHSVVMKRETLLPDAIYEGVPIRRVSRQRRA